ncbi:hypothetical protein PSAC2689_110046 [Paraburkholderia sacchari]
MPSVHARIGFEHESECLADLFVAIRFSRHQFQQIHHVPASADPPREGTRESSMRQADHLARQGHDAIFNRHLHNAAALLAGLVHGATQHFELAFHTHTDHAVAVFDRLQKAFADPHAQLAVPDRRPSANAQLVDERFAGAVSLGQLNQPFLRRNVRHLAGNSQGTALEADMNGGIVEFQVRFAFERCHHLPEDRFGALHDLPRAKGDEAALHRAAAQNWSGEVGATQFIIDIASVQSSEPVRPATTRIQPWSHSRRRLP